MTQFATELAANLNQRLGPDRYARERADGLRWITIGGEPDEEGGVKHRGGTPVLIDDRGRIHGGPDALTGKSLDNLKGEKGSGKPKDDKPQEPKGDDSPKLPPKPKPDPQPAADSSFADAETPREVAANESSITTPEYQFARESEIGNSGEDVANSARHKVNAWKGLAQAEADGTAAEFVTREQLLKNEPPRLAEHAAKNPLTTLAMHLALKKFPAKPVVSGQVSRTTSPKSRQEFVDVYRSIKEKAEAIAGATSDPADAIQQLQQHVKSQIVALRSANGRSDVASHLVPMYNALSTTLWGLRKTDVAHQVEEIRKATEGVSGPELGERVSAVLKGQPLSGLTGKPPARKPAKESWSPAELYVDQAKRFNGTDVSALTSDPATATHAVREQFGFRGIQWGNSVTDDERKHHIAKLAEAMTDLTEVLGLHPDDASLDGTLAIAIGARGKGNALAHYEPSLKTINLTRKNGVGSLAHEWGHAFDHQLGRGGKPWVTKEFASQDLSTESVAHDAAGNVLYDGQRPRMVANRDDPLRAAMDDLRTAFKSSGFESRMRAYLGRQMAAGMSRENALYWAAPHEVFARSFERYVQHSLRERGQLNTYLAGWKHVAMGGDLWPNDAETAAIAPAFDKLFAAYRESKGRGREQYSRQELVEYFTRQLTETDSSGSSDLTRQFDSAIDRYRRFRKPPKGSRWITIGGDRDGDAKHRGGFPVLISADGEILAGGPKGLRGRQVSEIGAYFEKRRNTPTARRKRWQSIVKRQAKKHGLSPAEYQAAAEHAWAEVDATHSEREQAKARARQLTGLNARDLSRFEDQYLDHSSDHPRLKNFDTISKQLADEFPGLGWGVSVPGERDDRELGGELWELIKEGQHERPDKLSPEFHAVVDRFLEELPQRTSGRRENPELAIEDRGDAWDEWAPEHSGSHGGGFNPAEFDRFSRITQLIDLRLELQRAVERYQRTPPSQRDRYAGFDPHQPRNEKGRWVAKSTTEAKSGIVDFKRRVLLGELAKDAILDLGDVPPTLGDRIQADAGIDVHDFAIQLRGDGVRHIHKNHEVIEPIKSQEKLVDADYGLLLDVILDPDGIRRLDSSNSTLKSDTNARGNVLLEFKKKIGQHRFLVVEVLAGKKQKALSLHTAWKLRASVP